MNPELTGTGHTERYTPADLHRIAGRMNQADAAARRDRTHLWIATVAYTVADPTSPTINLDHENLGSPPVLGCWVCEEPYQAGMERTACTGEPR